MTLFEQISPAAVVANSPWRAPFDGSLTLTDWSTKPVKRGVGVRAKLKKSRKQLEPLQEALYAGKQYSVLCVFQAMDAAGKDGTIREVFSGLDPAGIRLAAFKRPTGVELAHDFLWRTTLELPRRGEIGLFNRSYYEEVLTVRVHPEYLKAQYPGGVPDLDELWTGRFQAIREHERHLALSNTLVLKFWLNVSRAEQARRFLDRIDEPDKRWKFSSQDVAESRLRDDYDKAVEDMLNQTSRPWAPWFVIPADDKDYMRSQVADIVQQAMAALPLSYPQPDMEDETEMEAIAQELKNSLK